MKKMRGASLPGDHTIKLYEHEVPSPKSGEVLIEMKAVTLCGSDKGLFRGEFPFHRAPMQIAGHEGSGIVVNDPAGRFKQGERVLLYHASGCGECSYCKRGMVNLCKQNHGTYGFQRNGVLSKYVLAEGKDLIKLPDEVSFEDAASLACSFSSGYSAVKKAEISGRDIVYVSGLGSVGLGILMNAKAMGAGLLLASDDIPYRRELALKLGIADEVSEVSKALEMISEKTGGCGVEKSFDASGTAAGRLNAVRSLKEYGTATFMGEGEGFSLTPGDVMKLIHGERRIQGSWAVPLWEIDELLELIVRLDIHPSDMITHRYALKDIDEAFKTAISMQCGKVAITAFD